MNGERVFVRLVVRAHRTYQLGLVTDLTFNQVVIAVADSQTALRPGAHGSVLTALSELLEHARKCLSTSVSISEYTRSWIYKIISILRYIYTCLYVYINGNMIY